MGSLLCSHWWKRLILFLLCMKVSATWNRYKRTFTYFLICYPLSLMGFVTLCFQFILLFQLHRTIKLYWLWKERDFRFVLVGRMRKLKFLVLFSFPFSIFISSKTSVLGVGGNAVGGSKRPKLFLSCSLLYLFFQLPVFGC